MKMKVQEYLEANGLQALVDEFNIVVTDYPDRVVLNYNQIDSPRFNPICDECRALILQKDTWDVLARSFDRFYNVGEGEDWKDFPIQEARIDEKLDGSLLSLYNDGEKWCVSTRKMAFAEGGTAFGLTFAELFNEATQGTTINGYIATQKKGHTYVFELTSPMNRIVTRYDDTSITLIGIRSNEDGYEVGKEGLDRRAFDMGVARPKVFKGESIEDLQEQAAALNVMDEGFVFVVETDDGSFRRLKCKNPKYVAIAHLRDNGSISPRRIMTLVMANEHAEYLGYFPEDTKYFDFVEEIYLDSITRIANLWKEVKDIESQKDFALTIQKKAEYKYETGVLFQLRKDKTKEISDIIKDIDPKKLTKSLQLKEKFGKMFV
jgi:hypothetical protein